MQSDINWHIVTGTLGTLSPGASSGLAYDGTGVLAAMTATIQHLQAPVLLGFSQWLENSGLTLD